MPIFVYVGTCLFCAICMNVHQSGEGFARRWSCHIMSCRVEQTKTRFMPSLPFPQPPPPPPSHQPTHKTPPT